MKKKVQNKGWYRFKYNLEYKTILLVLVTLASTFLLTNNIDGESPITGAAVGYSVQTPVLSGANVNLTVFIFNDTGGGELIDDTIDANDADNDEYRAHAVDLDIAWMNNVPQVTDWVYFGLTSNFSALYFNISSSGIADSPTDTWEYYNGTNWDKLTTVNRVNTTWAASGLNIVNWTIPGNWSTYTINGTLGPYFYIRMNCTANCGGFGGHLDINQISAINSTTVADTTIPSVSVINSPTNGTTYISGNTILFNASVSDDTGITSVVFQISNGSNPGNLTGSSTNTSLYNASLTVSSANIIDGTHTLIVFASDAAGNINGTVNLTFITDTAAPSISSSSSSSVSTTSATLSATTNEVATCKYSNADQAYASMADTMGGSGGTSHSAGVTGLTSGRAYVYYIRCSDTPGNAQGSSTSISFTTTSSGGGSGGGGGSSSSSSTATATTTSTTTTSTTTSTTSTTATPATTTETQQFIQDNLVTVEVTAITAETVSAIGETTETAVATATVGAATTTMAGEETGETATAATDAVQTESINPVESVVISVVNNADKPISLQPVIVSEEAGVSIPNEQVIDAFLLARISEENIEDLSEAELKNLVEQEKRLFELIEKANVQPVYIEKTASLINQFSVDEAVEVIASVNIPVPPSSIGEVVNIEVDPEEFAVEGINFVIPRAEIEAEAIPEEEVNREAEVVVENAEEIIDENSIVGLENVPVADKVGVVVIEALFNLPAADLFQGEQFKQLDINVNVVDMINIKFRVPDEWINEVGIDKEDIGMYHYNELTGLWEELITEVVGIDDGFVHLEAQARGFSYFIIGEKKPQLTENRLNLAVRKVLNEGEPVQKQMMALTGIIYTGEQISGKLLESSLGTCGEIIVQPGEKFESTCKLKRGISLESESFNIKFTSQGKEVFEKEVGPRKGVIGTALDVNKEEGLLEFYMLIPERVDIIEDGEKEFDNYYLEISLNKNDDSLGEGVVYSDYFGPYKVKRDEGFIFAQQLAYDSQRYVGEYHIRTKVLNGDRVVAEHLFIENLGEEGTLPKRLSDDVFNEVASVVAVVLPLLSLLSFMFFRRRRVK